MFESRDKTVWRRAWPWGLLVLAGLLLAIRLLSPGDETSTAPTAPPRSQPLPIPGPSIAPDRSGGAGAIEEGTTVTEPATLPDVGTNDGGTAVAPSRPRPALPPLDASDRALKRALSAVTVRDAGLDRLLVDSDLIRRFVVMAENMRASRLPRRHLPVRPPAGRFQVARRADGALLIAPGNARRYRPYVHALEGIDPRGLVSVYRRFAPLFVEAWRALGRPRVDPDRRLLEAIDTMLAAPEPAGPIVLERFSVNYRFADPALEALPESQRLLIRIGPDNARRVKQWLRAVRSALTTPAGASR